MKKGIMLKTLECSLKFSSFPSVSLYTVCRYGHQARIVHFLGRNKPWHVSYKQQPSTEVAQRDSNRNLEKFVNLWWEEYYSHTKTHVNVSYELQDAEPIEQLEMLAAAPCSTHVATLPHVSPQMCFTYIVSIFTT